MSTQIVSPSPLANTIMTAPRAGLATIRTIFGNSGTNTGAGSNHTRRHTIVPTSSSSTFSRIDSSIFNPKTLAGTLSPMRSNSVSTTTTTTATTAAERYVAAVEREQQLQDYQLSTVNDRGYFIPPAPIDKGFKENMKELEGDFFERILLQTPPDRVGNLLSVNSTISPGMFSDPVHSSVRRKIKGRGGHGATTMASSRHQSIPSTFTRQRTTSLGCVPVTAATAATGVPVDVAQQKRAPTPDARTTRAQEGQAALAKNIPGTKLASTTTPVSQTADNMAVPPSPSSPPVQIPNKEQTFFKAVTKNTPIPSSSLPSNLSRAVQANGGGRQLTPKEIESKKSRHRARAQLSFLTGSKPTWGGLDLDNEDDEDMMNYGYDHSDVLFKKEASTSRTAAFLSDDILDSLLFSSTPSSTRSSPVPDLVMDSSASSSAASSPEVSPRSSSSGEHHRSHNPEKEMTRQGNARKLKARNDFGGVLQVA